MAHSTLTEIAEVPNPTVGGAWADISLDTYANDDYVTVQLIEDGGDRVALEIGPVKFGDISTTFVEKTIVSQVNIPQVEQGQNTTTTAITGSFVTFITPDAITPRSSSSKFIINVKGIAGSISGEARGDIQIQRKIGSAGWATVSTLSKNYMFLARFGNPPFGFGPASDSPNTTESVQYRAQFKRNTTGGHAGSWNCESAFMTVTEKVSSFSTERTMRIKRITTDSKLQYRLEGDIDSSSKLRVLKYEGTVADDEVTTDKIVDDAVTNDKVADTTLTPTKLNADMAAEKAAFRRLFQGGVDSKTDNYTLVADDIGQVILLEGSNARTFTMPDITDDVTIGWYVWVANVSTADLTITGNGSDTVDGSANYILSSGQSRVLVATTASSWMVLTKPPVTPSKQILTESSNELSIDLNNGNYFAVNLTGNWTLNKPDNAVVGTTFVVQVTQDSTGGRTLSYGDQYEWSDGNTPTLSTGADDVDYLIFFVAGSDKFIGTILTDAS